MRNNNKNIIKFKNNFHTYYYCMAEEFIKIYETDAKNRTTICVLPTQGDIPWGIAPTTT